MRALTKRQRLALRHAFADPQGVVALPTNIAEQLVGRGLVYYAGYDYERQEWNKVVARWPVVVLTDEGWNVARECYLAVQDLEA
jgi:hypothetical protein